MTTKGDDRFYETGKRTCGSFKGRTSSQTIISLKKLEAPMRCWCSVYSDVGIGIR